MSPPRTTTAENEVDISESAPVRMDVRTLVAIISLAFAGAGAWFTLHAALADAQVRISTLENARVRIDGTLQEQAVLNQKMTDALDHIREVTDQTARDVKDLQHRGH